MCRPSVMCSLFVRTGPPCARSRPWPRLWSLSAFGLLWGRAVASSCKILSHHCAPTALILRFSQEAPPDIFPASSTQSIHVSSGDTSSTYTGSRPAPDTCCSPAPNQSASARQPPRQPHRQTSEEVDHPTRRPDLGGSHHPSHADPEQPPEKGTTTTGGGRGQIRITHGDRHKHDIQNLDTPLTFPAHNINKSTRTSIIQPNSWNTSFTTTQP